MRASTASPHWHRVAGRYPRLRSDLAFRRQQARGQAWHVIADPAGGQHHRIDDRAWALVGRCDGHRTVQEIWDGLVAELRDDAPTQDDVLRVLARLEQSGLLGYDVATDAATLQQRREAQQRRGFVNPFALRVPLGDPSALLKRLDPVANRLFRPGMLLAWLAAVLAGLALAATHWDALALHAGSLSTARYLALGLVLFPLVKALHELGHALAVRRWGGAVHEAGFSLFALVPAPYVDASAAATFPLRRQRVIVGTAGILVELAIAALALAVWANVQPGLVRDTAYVALFICTISTLIFNANPLLPFDGYYVLCDALDLPNLASRSRAWWAARLGVATEGLPRPGRGETPWLVAYAPLSLACRIVLAFLMVLWIAGHSSVLAAIAAGIMAWLLVLRPAWQALRRWGEAAPGTRRRAAALSAGAAALAGIALFAVPLPHHTVASAIVSPPDQARLRAGTEGFVMAVPARDGTHVVPGDVLVVMDDPALHAERARLQGEHDRRQAESFANLLDEPGAAQNAARELARIAADLAHIGQRIARLEIRAQVAGTLVLPMQDDLPGTWVRQGTTLGYVLERTDISVRAAVPEYDAALVRSGTRHAEVVLAGSTAGAIDAQIVRDTPAATYQLPGGALGTAGGGEFPVDPSDKDGLRSIAPVVLVDLKLPATALTRVGGRAWVRFDHAPEPVGHRWMRRLRQVFLQHANPSA